MQQIAGRLCCVWSRRFNACQSFLALHNGMVMDGVFVESGHDGIGLLASTELPPSKKARHSGPWGTVCSYGAALAAHVARLVALPRLHSLHSLHSRQMAGQGLQRGPSHVPDLVVGGRSRGGPDGTELNRLMGECCRMLQMGTSPFPNSRPKMCCMMSNSIISQQSV